MSKPESLRDLPKVDVVINSPSAKGLMEKHGGSAVTNAVRSVIADLREELLKGNSRSDLDPESVISRTRALLEQRARPALRRIINATGIILHTGLGRAVIPPSAIEAMCEVAGYCNVQTDLETGERARREANVLQIVQRLTGAETALVVNNNAGATLLVLRALAQDREVVISRGELIEIGGSFRLPDIMTQSGAIMREVGTTNRTRPSDYESAIGPNTALLMKASKSNYEIVGFAEETGIEQLAAIGRSSGIPVADDLGCGAIVNLDCFGAPPERTMRDSLDAGADIALSSTDKLIGGPQGGLIVGKKSLLDQIRRHPLYRTLRVDKLTLAGLEATLKLFENPETLAATHPLYAMIAKPKAKMTEQAERLAAGIAAARPSWNISAVEEKSYVGGGSLPGSELPAAAVRIRSKSESPEQIALFFRRSCPPVIPYVRDDAVFLNMRTVTREESGEILHAARS